MHIPLSRQSIGLVYCGTRDFWLLPWVMRTMQGQSAVRARLWPHRRLHLVGHPMQSCARLVVSSSCKGCVRLAISNENLPNHLTMPKNLLSSDTECGASISQIASILSGSAQMPCHQFKWPISSMVASLVRKSLCSYIFSPSSLGA